MSENMRFWDALSKTDPKQTKGFKRAGGFSGTAIKPMWAFKRMTEQFGPIGEGWGMDKPEFQVVPGDNREVLVFCTVSVWFHLGSTTERFFGVGGDRIVTYIKANEQYKRPERLENDDESFKKAYTDALTNALKFLGVGADVHMGLFDDSKYVNTVNAEFREAEKEPAPEGKPTPFKNAAERKRFAEGVLASYKAVKTDAELSGVVEDYKPTVEGMKASGHEHDAIALDEFRKAYGEALKRIKADEESRAAFGHGFTDTPTDDPNGGCGKA